jgi:hypothetical protein
MKKEPFRFLLGGFFPILFNAIFIPMIIVFLCGGMEGYRSAVVAYFTFMGSIALTETVWV